MKKLTIVFIALLIIGCANETTKTPFNYVDVFIGTKAPGHTYPGATLPFGMVQLSPDTQNSYVTWPACAGYDYIDTSILGFSHTHLSGTGIPDLSDILLLPFTGKTKFNAGEAENPDTGYRSRFSHSSEKAYPGYYSVFLEDYKVKVELTVTKRTGVHKYTFPKADKTSILIDVAHRDPIMESSFEIISDTEVAGYRRSKAWAGDQRQYFVAKFSKPIISYEVEEDGVLKTISKYNGKRIVAALNFDASESEVLIEVALSAVSIENARKNLVEETTNFDFEKVKEAAKKVWDKALNKIEIEDDNEDKKTIFYTALYHSLLTPNLYSDVDGKYRGMDGEVHQSSDFNNYHVFSLWDTFRALHPLLTIVEPEVTRDLVVSLQNKYEQFGELPMWELASNDTRCMIGYHAVSIMADAYVKGITNVDAEKVLESMVNSAKVNKRGINYYANLGYVPTNKSSQSVSKTLEYAYDDWCIAQMAKKIGNDKVYEEFSKRARFFENLYDKETKFMRPRFSDRSWLEDFNPTEVGASYNFNFTEGNSYQYSLFVPHDMQSVINSVGGDAEFDLWLDNLFNANSVEEEEGDSDISGLIGQYAHGNEPSHHMAYLYNFSGKPWKSQERVHQILNEMYTSKPDGLCGNEDCGQMSAWYVLSAMGFYSVTPGTTEYIIGSPTFKKVTLHLDNGKDFVIEANNASSENIYIQNTTLNGSEYEKTFINHGDLLAGGTLTFEMANTPNKNWATSKESRPSSDTYEVVSIPYLKSDFKTFIDSKIIELETDTEGATIYYTVDGSEPSQQSVQYVKPFSIQKSTTLKVKAYKEGVLSSYTTSIKLKRSTANKLNKSTLKQGLNYGYFEGVFRSIYDWGLDTPKATGKVDKIDLSTKLRDEWFGLEFNGYIYIPADGKYNFEIAANDGAQLNIDGEELFESDGRKSADFTQKNDIILSKGLHKFEVKYFQCSDNIGLKVYWSGPRFKRQEIPSTVFYSDINF